MGVFAFSIAEESDVEDNTVSGSYDSETQLWYGNAKSFGTNGTNDRTIWTRNGPYTTADGVLY